MLDSFKASRIGECNPVFFVLFSPPVGTVAESSTQSRTGYVHFLSFSDLYGWWVGRVILDSLDPNCLVKWELVQTSGITG